MAATKGEGIPYETEDEDNVHLLRNEDSDKNGKNSKSTQYDDEKSRGILSVLASNYKLVITGLTVTSLILLGICVGAVSNKHQLLQKREADAFPYQSIRLPRDVLPEKYRVYLHPNLTTFHVAGTVRILVHCEKATDKIVLHSTHNKLKKVVVYEGDFHDSLQNGGTAKKSLVDITKQSESKKLQFLHLKLASELTVGKVYTIVIVFDGKLVDGLEGFYRSSYKTKSGEKRYIATTHFESTAARSAFPCFDEPDMKAKFKIVIVRETRHSALSNMPVKNSRKREDGLVVDHFEESVLMSTYLVAFVVCDFAYKEATTKTGNVKVRVWAPEDQIDQAELAIDVAPKVLEYYNSYFGVPFPLPKQDLIAIPDFSAGAMENWGLITYRLTSLLWDPRESSSANKQWVAVVIAHELAHQWFGNLVTMKWWNDLWLNEGFAAYVEFIGADHYNHTWKMMEQFAVDDSQGALALDSHSNSHPISVAVKNPAQINEIFDSISYDKGASIIRMLRNFIGGKAFHKGLQNYLRDHKFGNAETDDLWKSLSKTSQVDVKLIMDTWTLQMGYPLVTIVRDPENADFAIATQKHFLQDSKANVTTISPFGYKWEVPLTYKTKSGQRTYVSSIQWMHKTDDKVKFRWKQSDGWIKGNLDGIGFYRCNYDRSNWLALSKQLMEDHTVFSAADRANMIDDVYELARAEETDQLLALQVTAYIEKEADYTPLMSFLASNSYFGEVLQDRPGYSDYEAYMVKMMRPLVQKIGWKDDNTHLIKYLRSAVLRTIVNHGDPDSVKRAKALFKGWMDNDDYIPPNLRSTVYLGGIKYGGEAEWNFMWKKQSQVGVASEQRKLMFALTDTTDPKLLKRYLSWAINPSKIRVQDGASVIEAIAGNRAGHHLAWEFFKKNFDLLFKRYGNTAFDFSRLLKSTAGRFSSEEKLKEVQKFFGSHNLGSGTRAAKQAIENIKNHIQWLRVNELKVTNWLKKQVSNSA